MRDSRAFIVSSEHERIVMERTGELQRRIDELRAEIAELKLSEDALSRNVAYLVDAQRLSNAGSWVYDTVGGVFTYWSPEQYRIWGFDPEAPLPSTEKDRALHPPEEWARLMEAVGRAIREKTDFETDARLEFRDGTIKYLRVISHPVVNDSGDVVELIGTTIDVTDWHLAEDTNRRLAWIVESTDDSVLSRTPEGIITSWNKGAEKVFGYSAEEMIGRHISTLIPADSTDEVRDIIESAKRGESQRLETVRVRKDGKRINVALTISAIRDAHDRVVGASVIARDITERKRNEERQARAAQHTTLRGEIAAAFNQSSVSLRSVLQSCAEAVVRRLGAAFARIWTFNEDQNMLELQASAGLYTHIDGQHSRIPMGMHKIGLVAAERRPTLINSVQDDERVHDKEWARREGMISFAGYPLTVEGRVVGALGMFARHVLEHDTIEVLESIAPVIAQGVERKRTEEQLKLIKYTIDHVRESAAWIDSDARFIFANDAICSALGYTREELLELTVHDVDPNFPPDVWPAHLENLRAQKSLSLESVHRRKDGSTYPVELSLNNLHYNGQEYLFAFGRDITERKQREAELRAKQELLDLAQKAARAMAFDWYIQKEVNTWSTEQESLYGLPPGSFDGTYQSWKKLIHPDDWHLVVESIKSAHETGAVSAEYRVIWPDGSTHWLAARGQMFFDDEGEPVRMVGFTTDITARKQRDEAMQLLTTRLLHLQDEERRRIARNLHDVTAQDLGAVVVNLAHLRRLVTDLKPEAQTIVTESASLAEQVLQQIRTLSYLLHPPSLDEAGLASALRWYVEGFTKRSGIQVEIEITGMTRRLPLDIETALFRITQECLTNIHRHSGSSVATIRLIKTGQNVILLVKDKGSGMIDEAAGETLDSIQSLGLGILGMRQRLRQFGGALELNSNEHGTEIIASVPIPGE